MTTKRNFVMGVWKPFFFLAVPMFHVMLQPESRSCSYHISTSSKGTMKGKKKYHSR